MPPRTVRGSFELGSQIRSRRIELGYSIEEAASKASIGAKTWSRYESGESIRADKLSGVLRTLKWKALPDEDLATETMMEALNSSHPAWSTWLERVFGPSFSMLFAAGYDLIDDYVREDIEGLSSRPSGTHLGELGSSVLAYLLPSMYLMRYDFEFLYALKFSLERFKLQAKKGEEIVAHTVLDEIVLHLIEEEGRSYFELAGYPVGDELDDFLVDLCGDADIEIFLYGDLRYMVEETSYRFGDWLIPQFWLPDEVEESMPAEADGKE